MKKIWMKKEKQLLDEIEQTQLSKDETGFNSWINKAILK